MQNSLPQNFMKNVKYMDSDVSDGKAPEAFLGVKNASGYMEFCRRGRLLFGSGSGVDHL